MSQYGRVSYAAINYPIPGLDRIQSNILSMIIDLEEVLAPFLAQNQRIFALEFTIIQVNGNHPLGHCYGTFNISQRGQ